MLTIAHPNKKLVTVRALLLVSIPLALMILSWASLARAGLSVILTICGVVMAVVAGCTKIGSP